MKVIQCLSDQIAEEIEDAEKYAKCALTYKNEYPQLSETYYRIANEEITHMTLLHSQVVTMIEDYKKLKGEIPEGMKTLYDILHRKHIEHLAAVKALLALYKEF